MPVALQASASVTLDASGSGTASLGPSSGGGIAGPGTWSVTGVILQTSRPNVAPIPRAQVYLGTVDAGQSQGLTSNGSFNTARGKNLVLARGQQLFVVWTGGQSGDVATVTVTGVKQ